MAIHILPDVCEEKKGGLQQHVEAESFKTKH